DARAEVPRWIDGVSRSAAEREADGPDENAYQIGPDAGCHCTDRLGGRGHGDEDENKGANDFRNEVGERVANRRRSTENAQLEVGIGGFFPVRKILQPNKDRSADRTQQLRGNIKRELRVIAESHGSPEGKGGIEEGVLAATGHRDKNSEGDRKGP